MNARYANKRFMYSTVTLVLTLIAIFVLILLAGCGENPQRNVTQTPQPNWRYEGQVAYYFPNPNLVVIRYNNTEANIPRQYQNGQDGWIEWEWEEDGDIDIEVAGHEYDLDSPYDFDWNEEWGDDYYQDAGDGWAWVMVGGVLVKKKKSKLGKNYRMTPKGYHYTKRTKNGSLKQTTTTRGGVTEKVSVVKTKKGTVKTMQVIDTYGNKSKISEFKDKRGKTVRTMTVKTSGSAAPKKAKRAKSNSSKSKKR